MLQSFELALDAKVVAALVSAAAALVLGLINLRQTRKLSSQKVEFDRELEQMKAELRKDSKSHDARVDYEYDARKRLYTEIEPILYQSAVASKSLFSRIKNVSKAGRLGNLGDGPGSWLRKGYDGYYRRSLVYRILRPAALHQIIQRRLTNVDLQVDTKIRSKIDVLTLLSEIMSEHFKIAEYSPSIYYNPYYVNPAKYQGIYSGHNENAALLLCDRLGTEQERLMTFGEFEQRLDENNMIGLESVKALSECFEDFHPDSHKVLWRLLLASACYSYVLVRLSTESGNVNSSLDYVEEFKIRLRSNDEFIWYDSYIHSNRRNDVNNIFDTVTSFASSCLRNRNL